MRFEIAFSETFYTDETPWGVDVTEPALRPLSAADRLPRADDAVGEVAGAALGLGARPGEPVVSLGTSGTAYAVMERRAADPSGTVAGFADASGRFLLGPSDSWDGRAGNLRVEPTGVPVAEHTVRDSGATTGPAGNRPTRPEIDVIGVSNYNQRTFDLVVSKNHTYSRQPTLMATRPKNPTLL